MTPLFLAGATWRERVLSAAGAAFGIAVTGLFCVWFDPARAAMPLLAANMGASAVLLFAVPASPLAQPWPVIGGNILSVLVGILVARTLGTGGIAAGVAVGGAIALMSATRCLHPPGGAAALIPVLGGPAVLAQGWWFAAVPMGVNAAVLLASAWAFHGLTGRAYPHHAKAAPSPAGVTQADVAAALEEAGETFDIDAADLQMLIARAEVHARRRQG